MTALQEAFARVGIHGYGVRQVGRQLAVTPVPQQPRKTVSTIDERMSEELAEVVAMTDDELAVKEVMFAENLEAIRIELRLVNEGEVERPREWRPKAERATAMIKGRLGLVRVEMERRKRIAAKAGREQEEANRQRRLAEHERFNAESQEHKRQRLEMQAARYREREKQFVDCAKRLLPPETFAAIWTAVDTEAEAEKEDTP